MTHYKFFTVSDYTHCSFLMTFSPESSNFAPPTGNKFDLKLRINDLSKNLSNVLICKLDY